jgi:putative phosphoesterase
MRVASLYDIHGNLPALEAVIADVRRAQVDRIVVGGDVFPGPLAPQCLDLLLSLDVPTEFIRGNGDRAVIDMMLGRNPASVPEQAWPLIKWNADRLDEVEQRILESWPPTIAMKIDGIGQVLFCHATPQSDRPIFTRLTVEEKLLPIFAAVDADLVVCGHTHMQYDRSVGSLRVVNSGSVGMPFGKPGAYWLELDDGAHLRRTEYHLDAAAERIRNSGYPQANEFAERSVIDPPSEDAMLSAYAGVELKQQ